MHVSWRFRVHCARNRSGAVALLLCAVLLLTGGCSGDRQVQRLSPPLPEARLVDEYVIQPYDALEIKFFHNPELNEIVTVRPDGMISLQMIDEVRAAGLTPSQLDALLTQKY
ncbi:MAG: polysaccharide biosynthesis/export family protein, partial [Desulfomonilia bacterium]